MANLLYLNDEQRRKHAKQARIDKHQADIAAWIVEQTKNCMYVEDGEFGFDNYEKQLGNPMTSAQLEARLKTILPSNCFFYDNPWNPTKKAIMRRTPTGLDTIVAYERGFQPEHSVLRVKVEDYPDPNVVGPRRDPISRSNLPKYEWDEKKREFTFDDEKVKPGFIRRKIPYGEAIRGWRTVAIYLVKEGICTPAQIESVLGRDDSKAWATHMGRQAHQLPF